MNPVRAAIVLALGTLPLGAGAAAAQDRPNFSGVWRLVPEESRMIGAGGRSAPAQLGDRQITWLVLHREPEIAVVVNVRDPDASREFSFRCTTDGRTCVNELPELNEVRRMSAGWQGGVLVMTQRAETPHGSFDAEDRLTLADDGQRLVFERTVRNQRGERPVRQVFRKLGPHPSERAMESRHPSVELPPGLARVLRDYERHWQAGAADSLAALFTEDGFATGRGGWISGREALLARFRGNTSSPLRLRALSYAAGDTVAYIIGAYGYGAEPDVPDRGRFILALRRSGDGPWLIAGDLDASSR